MTKMIDLAKKPILYSIGALLLGIGGTIAVTAIMKKKNEKPAGEKKTAT